MSQYIDLVNQHIALTGDMFYVILLVNSLLSGDKEEIFTIISNKKWYIVRPVFNRTKMLYHW